MAAFSYSSSIFPPLEDPTSPYFLHHGGNPSMFLVFHVLCGDNYNTCMLMALSTNNKIGFVDGSLVMPTNLSDPLFS